jgi:2-hydroxy-6-oxonona-2,4-dienedioate hydrolase
MTRFSAEQTSRFVRIEDGGRPFNVHYNDVGDGERVVVMLHGSGPGATAWGNFNRNIDAVVDAGFRVLLIDFPGWGQSDPVVCAESRSDFNARVVKALIDQLQIERITPIGNSMGAHSAVAFALDYPQNLDKLTSWAAAPAASAPSCRCPPRASSASASCTASRRWRTSTA